MDNNRNLLAGLANSELDNLIDRVVVALRVGGCGLRLTLDRADTDAASGALLVDDGDLEVSTGLRDRILQAAEPIRLVDFRVSKLVGVCVLKAKLLALTYLNASLTGDVRGDALAVLESGDKAIALNLLLQLLIVDLFDLICAEGFLKEVLHFGAFFGLFFAQLLVRRLEVIH